MSTVDKLARTKPKENAGSRSSNRFEYQINWGLNLLLKMEEANEDYIMILDYHDDIVVCNSDSGSEYIDFYQIKTNISNMWTLGGLVGDNKNKMESSSNPDFGLSIIAKLISHVIQFEDSRKLYFVTNSRLSKNIYEPTLKSKACLKCLYFTKIISALCCYLEYFSYLYTIN